MKDVAKKLYLKQKKYQKNENMKLKKKQTDSSVDTHIKEGLKENLQRFSFKIQKNTKNPQVLNSFEVNIIFVLELYVIHFYCFRERRN